MKRLAIFASGSGTNAENIIRYFQKNKRADLALVVASNADKGAAKRAVLLGVPTLVLAAKKHFSDKRFCDFLVKEKIDLIILAGFLFLIPEDIIRAFPNKIINIHPALLPKYGGKGMYGNKVHQAVINNKEKESGITIHYVNEKYDEGEIIFQAKCEVSATDTPETLAQKIHQLEYAHFPVVIEKLLDS
jgi:phosphoribosylglycinamide formyltransferase-1